MAQEKNPFQRAEKYILDKYDLRFNTVLQTIDYKEKIGDDPNLEDDKNMGFKEVDELVFYAELKRKGFRISSIDLKSILKSKAEKYNPIKSYFQNLSKGDEEKDYINELSNYIILKDEKDRPRFQKHLKKMFVRSVACALEDKVFNKQVFVLVHNAQNSGKTSFCRWLCPEGLNDYYTEDIDINNKDGLISLSNNFIINLDELATLWKSEANKLKSMISQQFVKVRPPYGTKDVKMTRIVSFVGSTNETQFLTDSTGNVRWLCFELEKINWDYSKVLDIDKIWHQAYRLYINNFKYQLNESDIQENEKANERFVVVTDEQEVIQSLFQKPDKNEKYDFMTSTDIFEYIKASNLTTRGLSPTKIGKTMKTLGFVKVQERKDGKKYPEHGYRVIRLKKDYGLQE